MRRGVISLSELLAPLPPSVAEIAEVIGREEALSLVGQLPVAGSRSWRVCLYVPKRLPANHKLVALLGWRNASRLSRIFSGEILQPSNCRLLVRAYRNRQIVRMAGEGLPIDEIAACVLLSPYRVREIIAEQP